MLQVHMYVHTNILEKVYMLVKLKRNVCQAGAGSNLAVLASKLAILDSFRKA
jgi:hypothetical protein